MHGKTTVLLSNGLTTVYYLQQTFQVVLATDGRTSFAILIYDDPDQIVDITSDASRIGMIGFDSGDLRTSTTLLSTERITYQLENTNIFRIDGNYNDG